MSAATAPKHLTHFAPDDLPPANGVVLVLCKKRDGTYAGVASMKCADIRRTICEIALDLASDCDGELSYWVCTDPQSMDAALAEASKIAP